jgi:hypothetical protein
MSTNKSDKATPDWLVGFACSECPFSTKSGLSGREHVEWHKQQDRLYKELEDKTVELGVQGAVNALNSYSPDRDKLARELAEAWLNPAAVDRTPQEIDTAALELLRLLQGSARI